MELKTTAKIAGSKRRRCFAGVFIFEQKRQVAGDGEAVASRPWFGVGVVFICAAIVNY